MEYANDNQLPRTRAEAKKIGRKQYCTGKSCKHGHFANRNTSDGACMECSRIHSLKRYHDNQEEWNAKSRAYNNKRYAEDPAFRKDRIEYQKSLRRDPIRGERKRQYDRTRRANMSDEERIQGREYARLYQRKRCTNSVKARLDRSMSGGVYKSIRGLKAGRSWESLVGYNLPQLMRHLEKKFLAGMSWDNYGRGGWHIDHKTPKNVFNYTAPDHIDFKKCWALKNLQPLWEPENISKSDKLAHSFQPSLAF